VISGVIEEIREEIKKFLKFNKNERTIYQNLWDTAKAVLRGNFIAMNAYIINTERSQINDLMLQLKLLEKEEQAKPKTSRKRKIIKIRVEISKIKTKKKKTYKDTSSSYLKQTTMSFFLSSVKLVNRRAEQVLPWEEGVYISRKGKEFEKGHGTMNIEK
jgi:hypothetical protein